MLLKTLFITLDHDISEWLFTFFSFIFITYTEWHSYQIWTNMYKFTQTESLFVFFSAYFFTQKYVVERFVCL